MDQGSARVDVAGKMTMTQKSYKHSLALFLRLVSVCSGKSCLYALSTSMIYMHHLP